MHSIFQNFQAEFLLPLVFLNTACGLPLDPLLIAPFSEVCVCHKRTLPSPLEVEETIPSFLPLYPLFA